jgi:hypothetical protein
MLQVRLADISQALVARHSENICWKAEIMATQTKSGNEKPTSMAKPTDKIPLVIFIAATSPYLLAIIVTQ